MRKVGIYYAYWEDSIEQAIITAGPYLSALHLGETNRKPPGCGRMPWIEIKNALEFVRTTLC